MYDADDLKLVMGSDDDFVCKAGRNWRHKYLSEHNSVALRIDSDFRDRIKTAFNSKQIVAISGVLSESKFSTRSALLPHIENKFILHIDIRSYYECLRYEHVNKDLNRFFNRDEADFIRSFYFGDFGIGLRRGLCASPFIAEIFLVRIDRFVKKVIHDLKAEVLYTRFYDDIFLSSQSKAILRCIEEKVGDELLVLGFLTNDRKTKLTPVNTSKLLGLRVHQSRIVVPKEVKNKARLRVHYAKGLYDKYMANEWFYDYDRIERAFGTAIGTIRYILNNSDIAEIKWKRQLDECYTMLRKIQLDKEIFYQDDSPVLVPVEELKKQADEIAAKINDMRRNDG